MVDIQLAMMKMEIRFKSSSRRVYGANKKNGQEMVRKLLSFKELLQKMAFILMICLIGVNTPERSDIYNFGSFVNDSADLQSVPGYVNKIDSRS
jgi:hypothetical protein